MEASSKKDGVVASLLGRLAGPVEATPPPMREPALPPRWPEHLAFRKRPKPYFRAIPWTPLGGETQHDRQRPYELFVAQSVLREVRRHLITSSSGEPFGFLLGQVAYCPWTEAPYIVVDAIRRETQNLPPANEIDRFRHAWIAAGRDARHRRGDVIGWYHRHGVLGLNLSEWDLRLQEEFFPEPWHCALVVASTPDGIVGGFIQRSYRARLFRKGLAPFYELVDVDSKLIDGFKASVVDWVNYLSSEPVSVIRAEWPGASQRARKWKTPDHGREADLPTGPEMGGGRSGALGGRSWRAPDGGDGGGGGSSSGTRTPGAAMPDDAAAETRKRSASRRRRSSEAEGAEAGFTDEFSEAVRTPSVPESSIPRGQSAAADVPAGETPAPKRTPARKTAKEPSRKGDDVAVVPTEGATGERGWYSEEFREAVWGPMPFEPEADERDPASPARGAVASRGETDASDDDAETSGEAVLSRFELLPTFEPEPVETDAPDSAEWLLELISDGFARGTEPEVGGAPEPEATDAPEPEVGGAPEPAAADAPEPEAAGAPEPAAADAPEPEAAGAPEAEAADAPEPAAAGGEASASPGLPRPPSPRTAFVAPSSDPERDPEAPIPVVLFQDEKRWPSERQKRGAAALGLLILGAMVVFVIARGEEPPVPSPGRPRPAPAADAPTPEFIRLTDAFVSDLETFREAETEHRLGRLDCAGLGERLASLEGAFGALQRYVATVPALAERIDLLTIQARTARERFVEAGCPLEDAPPGGGLPDGTGASDSG